MKYHVFNILYNKCKKKLSFTIIHHIMLIIFSKWISKFIDINCHKINEILIKILVKDKRL